MKGEALREWRNHWTLILTGIVGTTCIGAHVYPVGTVMKPLQAEFGWSRAEIAASATISSISTLILSTFVGFLLDRYGPKKVAMVGTPLAAAVMMTIGFTPPSVPLWLAAWTLYALVAVLILPITFGAAITSAFHASRGLALGIGLCGSGVAAAFYPPYTLWLIETFGVRGVYPGLSLFILFSLGPLLIFAFNPPWTPAAGPKIVTPDLAAPPWGMTLKQALRTTLLWRIVLVLAASAVAASSINVHIQALLNDRGLSPGQAVSIAAVTGPSVLFGRWLGGWLLDRYHARWIAFAFYVLPAAGCLLLVDFNGSYSRGLVAAILIGLSIGVEGDLLPFLLSRYFGVRWFGSIYGFGMAIFGLGYAIGPLSAGRIFDVTGSYNVFLIAVIALMGAGGLVALTLGRYPDETNKAPST